MKSYKSHSGSELSQKGAYSEKGSTVNIAMDSRTSVYLLEKLNKLDYSRCLHGNAMLIEYMASDSHIEPR